MKMTFQPKKRSRAKVHGFRARMSSAGGRKVLASRRAKGRKKLSAQAACIVAFSSIFRLLYRMTCRLVRKGVSEQMESIKKNSDFQKVYRDGKSLANKYLVMYMIKNESERNRIGISVSKRVGNSVVRHRITRLIREGYRLNEEKFLTGYDFVVIARATAKGKSYQEIESAILHLGRMHGIVRNEMV